MATEAGHHASRVYRDQSGDFHLNSAKFFNDAEEDIADQLEQYGPGGAVTQITSSSTGVTLNAKRGQITTVALTTAAGAEERFTVTNSKVAAVDIVVVGTTYAGAGTPAISVVATAAGSFDIVITNLHAANALNEVVVVNFMVLKGAIS